MARVIGGPITVPARPRNSIRERQSIMVAHNATGDGRDAELSGDRANKRAFRSLI
jgi:hypothetical protein